VTIEGEGVIPGNRSSSVPRTQADWILVRIIPAGGKEIKKTIEVLGNIGGGFSGTVPDRRGFGEKAGASAQVVQPAAIPMSHQKNSQEGL